MRRIGQAATAVSRHGALRSLVGFAAGAAWALSTLIATCPRAEAQSASEIVGRWATEDLQSIVELRPCVGAESTICGRILWLWDPNDAQGKPRSDAHNPTAALRSRPLVGLEIVKGLKETAPGEWGNATLYDPDAGRTYSGAIKVKNRILELKGCSLGMFCENQIWRRPEDVIAAMRSPPS